MTNKIKALRLSRAWSQEQLAELCSLSVRTIQRIENGGQASLETLSAIAAVFEVNVNELYSETPIEMENDEGLDSRITAARTRVAREYAFYRSVFIWFIVCSGLAVINLLTAPDNKWFLYPTLIWGTLLAIGGLRFFILADWLQRRQQRRLQQLLRK